MPKLIALEEHYSSPEMSAAWDAVPPEWQDPSLKLSSDDRLRGMLSDLGEQRLRHMDETGVDVQVLSLTTPATQILEPGTAVRLARMSNDAAARAVAAHPTRFQAFATLPTPDPAAAVRELERCVSELGLKGAMLMGRTRDRPLDATEFRPMFEAAARLRVPLYLHPQIPPKAVRDILYGGFGDKIDTVFASHAWGWHAEAGIQAIRLILSGLFDRLPDLQIILGHWGEVVMLFMERIGPSLDRVTEGRLDRTIQDTFRSNFYVTPGGILSQRYLRDAVEVMGVDRIMFAADYPYRFTPEAGTFLTDAALSDEDRAKIAYGNWERLTGGL